MQDNLKYTFSGKLKTLSFIMMAIGAIAIAAGFATNHEQTWANIMHNNFYFLTIALGGLFFYALQYAAEVGWSVYIIRVPLAMSQFLWVSGAIMLIIFLAAGHHIWHWMHHELIVETLPDGKPNPDYDEVLAGKSGYLNVPFFLIRMVLYFVIWFGFAHLLRKHAAAEDMSGAFEHYERSRKLSIIFLVLFAVTSSTSAWDFVMSIDSHWFSTLYGWYTFAGIFISSLCVMSLIVVYLRKLGYLHHLNENHLHDIGKFMFAFSIFWTYLWFAQFMLIWYANLPEEVTYFMVRQDYYRTLFIVNFLINFILPFLFLMTRDSKRKLLLLALLGTTLFIGHWIDTFLMIMPGIMDQHWTIGVFEIGTTIGFMGLFIFVVFNALSKLSLLPTRHPMLVESEHFTL
ncbi:MAG: quinol:cytochrome C oxidoreductase [Bacteroidetes bacterium]|jgi:hypothetical protein|nr:quinol:cytochrome C oxidoreductase [Bacteroidota bacterium]